MVYKNNGCWGAPSCLAGFDVPQVAVLDGIVFGVALTAIGRCGLETESPEAEPAAGCGRPGIERETSFDLPKSCSAITGVAACGPNRRMAVVDDEIWKLSCVRVRGENPWNTSKQPGLLQFNLSGVANTLLRSVPLTAYTGGVFSSPCGELSDAPDESGLSADNALKEGSKSILPAFLRPIQERSRNV